MKQRMVSGIKPSGDLHIGNYLGAIAQWVKLQDEYDVMLFVADMHAITVPQKPEDLKRRTIEFVKTYLAAGLDPSKVTIFVQSHIHEHAELCWILNTVTRVGDLEKMTQFKDKVGIVDTKKVIEKGLNSLDTAANKTNILIQNIENSFKESAQFADEIIKLATDEYQNRNSNEYKVLLNENVSKLMSNGDDLYEINSLIKEDLMKVVRSLLEYFSENVKQETAGVGLFDYPVLMAGDIMMYDATLVPVGDDQVQHIELARTLGRRFNKRFGEEIFTMPKPLLQKSGARIMALDNPQKKMSKSATAENSFIALMDEPEKARKKIMKAMTDSGTDIVYSDDKPALKNLITIYALLADKETEDIEKMYAGKGYAEFKTGLSDVVVAFLTDFQAKYAAIDDEKVLDILKEGVQKARPLAQAKMREVKRLVGFVAE